VSFTKGCYTGQEIVTRTHYLGEVKRQLTLAMCEPTATIEVGCAIFDENNEKVGDVLLAQLRNLPRKIKDAVTEEIETTTINKMLVLCVLNVEVTQETLHLENETRDILKIIDGRKS
jgi:folate-binding Fe-S cluster repair protein YgfZ